MGERAAIYVRQSKDVTGAGLAVERQRADCQRLAAERGWEVVATFTDNDLSASSGKPRPGYLELLALVDTGAVEVVIAWHVDRLTRRLAELEDLIARCETAGVRVATVSGDLDLSTDAGRLVGRILGAVARGEIERKSARQQRAALQAAESGREPARRAFGFADGAHVPAEAAAVRELYRRVLAGMSMVAATNWLNDEGLTTTTGKRWDRSSTRVMLLNPRNAGLRALRGQVIAPGRWEPLVDEAVWRATVELLTDPARKRSRPARRWLGGGLYRCHCGARVRANYSHHSTRVYQCQSSAHLSRAAEPIDELVRQVIAARLRRPDAASLLADGSAGVDVAGLRDHAAALRLRVDQLAADYAVGLLTGRQVQVASSKISVRLEGVERQLADAGRGTRLAPLLSAPDPGHAFLAASINVQQAAVAALATITILRGTPGRAPFNPNTIGIEWNAP
jgi:site-specific DNA recombinase